MNDGILARTLGDLRSHWRAAFGFHVLVQLLGFAVFTPLVTWIGSRLVLASGEAVVSNFDIARYVLSPVGAFFVVVIAALSVALLLAEFTGLSFIAECAMARRRASVTASIAYVVTRGPALVALGARVLLRLLLLALPFLAAAAVAWFTWFRAHDVNYYLAEQPPEWRRATLLAVVLAAAWALLAARQLARWLYAIPILVLERPAPGRALELSCEMTRGRLWQIVVPLALWWLAVTAVAIAITWACRQGSDAGLDWAGLDVRRVLPLVAVYLAVSIAGALLYGATQLAGHQFMVTRMYAEQRGPGLESRPPSAEIDERRSRLVARPVLAGVCALPALALAAAAFLATRLDLAEDVAITAHRGAKAVAPENTMAAFRAAMDAGATYAELDVQHTRDRRLVVIHDGDLMRMADDPRRVSELTASEISAIDVGRKAGAQFAGESPPTLEEVIDLVRGRMKLNVELKYNVPDAGLAPAVVELLRREDFLDDAVVTSLDYGALKQVEELEPRIRTGHIVTAAVGDVVRSQADFLSLNSARVDASLVRRAHSAGKQVHVWTVNDPEVMLRMVERGVDNVITDDPALLARVMRERDGLGTAEKLGLRLRVLFGKPPPGVTDPETVEAL